MPAGRALQDQAAAERQAGPRQHALATKYGVKPEQSLHAQGVRVLPCTPMHDHPVAAGSHSAPHRVCGWLRFIGFQTHAPGSAGGCTPPCAL